MQFSYTSVVSFVILIFICVSNSSEVDENLTLKPDNVETQENENVDEITKGIRSDGEAEAAETTSLSDVSAENQELSQRTTTEVNEFEKSDTNLQNNYELQVDNDNIDETTESTVVAEKSFVSTSDSTTAENSSPNTDRETISVSQDEVLTTTESIKSTTDTNIFTDIKHQLNDTSILDDNIRPLYQQTFDKIVKAVESNLLDVRPSAKTEDTTTEKHAVSNETEQRLDRLSDQVRAIIRHYQAYGEVTVPNADIPDPMDIPDVKKNFGGSPTTFTTMKMYGLSDFTISQVNTDLNKMQVYVLVMMKRLVILGNYSIKSFFMRKNGPFNVTLLDVETEGAAELKRDENGTLQASDSTIDMTFRDAVVDFKNLGMIGSVLQGAAATAAPVLFEAVKPVVMKEINERIRSDINNKLLKIGSRISLTGSRPPLDAAVEEGRIYVKENGYDPYYLKDYSARMNVFTVNVTEFVLYGLSRFQRVGEVVLAMDEGTVQIGIHIAVLNLHGKCKWVIGIDNGIRRVGYTNFTIDHIQVRAIVNQSLDLKNKPILDQLDVNTGKVRVKMDGTGRFDIIVEILVNTLPELLRHIVIDAFEVPLRYKVQTILNRIEPEVVLEKTLPELDNLGI